MIEGLKKRIKPTGRKIIYMESSLNQIQTLWKVFHGNSQSQDM